MRTYLFICLLVFPAFPTISSAFGDNAMDSLSSLRKEVLGIIKRNTGDFPDVHEQEVTVGFLINARNELIVLDVQGDSDSACEYVKEVLNYKKVKYKQARQLTRYSIKIQLVRWYS